MMSSSRFSGEFKRDAVRQITEQGFQIEEVANGNRRP